MYDLKILSSAPSISCLCKSANIFYLLLKTKHTVLEFSVFISVMQFKRKSTKWRAARIKCEEKWTEAGESRSRRKHYQGKEGKERKFSIPRESYTHISINTQDSNRSRWPRDYSPSIPTPLLPQTGHWSFACVPVIPAQCRVVCWPGLFSPTVHSNGNPVAYKMVTFTPGLHYHMH